MFKANTMEEKEHEDVPLLQKSTTTSSTTRLITVEPITFAVAASISLTIAMQPIYIEERLAQDRNYTLSKDNDANGTCASMNTSDPDYIIQQEIAAEMATWSMINYALSYLPIIFLVPFFGVLSDRIGRKITFAIPMIAHLVFCVLLLLIFYLRFPLAVLALANFVQGLGGSISFFLAGCYAYLSDISSKKSRLVRLAVLQTVQFLAMGIVAIPLGYMIDAYGAASVAWLSFALLMAGFLYLTIPGVLLEPLHQDNAMPISIRHLFNDLYDLFAQNDQNRRYRLLAVLVLYFITGVIQLTGSATLFPGIYGLGPPFCWSSVTWGYFYVTYLLTGGMGLMIGTKLFSLCLKDHYILQVAFLVGGLSNVFLAWAPTTTWFFIGVICGCLRSMDGPVFNAILSKLVNQEEYGAIFAVQTSVTSVASMISPLVLNSIYSATVKTNPALVFIVIAALFGVLFVLTWLWIIYTKNTLKSELKISADESNILLIT